MRALYARLLTTAVAGAVALGCGSDDEADGSAGSGGSGGAAMDAGDGAAASAGAAGAAGAGGAAGGGASGAGGSAGAPVVNECNNLGDSCSDNSDCCVGDPAGGACVFNGRDDVCVPRCQGPLNCETGCCRANACLPSDHCVMPGCLPAGYACSATAECCGAGDGSFTCAAVRSTSPQGFCAAVCTDPADCTSGCCQRTGGGISVCAPRSECPVSDAGGQ